MAEQRAREPVDAGAELPMWLQCLVALVGAVVLAGPAAAVVWYR